MNKETKIIVGIIAIAIIILVSIFVWFQSSGLRSCCSNRPYFSFEKNLTNKTLRIVAIDNSKYSVFSWSDIEVVDGNATLPTGHISLGDIITNCSGIVILRFIPENIILGSFSFEE